jgi:hypothetical protein
MLTLTDLTTLPRSGFCEERGVGTCLFKEYQYVNMPLLPPIWIQIQFEYSSKKLPGDDLI